MYAAAAATPTPEPDPDSGDRPPGPPPFLRQDIARAVDRKDLTDLARALPRESLVMWSVAVTERI